MVSTKRPRALLAALGFIAALAVTATPPPTARAMTFAVSPPVDAVIPITASPQAPSLAVLVRNGDLKAIVSVGIKSKTKGTANIGTLGTAEPALGATAGYRSRPRAPQSSNAGATKARPRIAKILVDVASKPTERLNV